jgi:signal transduction histidine kinase/DNA-binding NarL/FixJ family response regulator
MDSMDSRFRQAACSMVLQTIALAAVIIFLAPAMPAVAAETTLAEWHEIERAVEYDPFGEALKAQRVAVEARKKGDKVAEEKALLRLSLARGVLLDNAPNEEDERRGEELARELKDMSVLCWYIEGRAWIAWHDSKFEEAEAIRKESLEIAQRNHLDVWVGWSATYHGIVLNDSGRKAEALKEMTRAYEIFEAMHYDYATATVLGTIGDTYAGPLARPEDQAKAAEYYLRSLDLLDMKVFRAVGARTYARLGLTYMRRDDPATAERMMMEAVRLADAMHFESLSANASMHLAGLNARMKHYDKALAFADRAVDFYTKNIDRYMLIGSHMGRAEALAGLGRKKESMDALASALKLVPELNTPSGEELYYRRAADIYFQLGEYREAYVQMLAWRGANKRMADAVNARLGDELKVKFEVHLKDAENARLKAQEKEAETRRVALLLALALSVLVFGGAVFYLRRRAADAHREAAHQKALAEAELAANHAKGAFLANMSHELRSPLNTMLGFTRMLAQDKTLRTEARDDVGIVLRSGEHLYSLINQVLDLSKIEAGRIVLVESDADLYALLDELGDMFSMTSRQKSLQLQIDSAPEVPKHIRVDAIKLRQVLINLLGNALKFTSEGGVTLSVGAQRSADGCILSFAVADTGPGIAPEEIGKLGQAFVQAQAGMQSREGTGLGLAISTRFVQIMGGELKIDSRPGQGTTMSFTIPVKIVSSSDAASATAAAGMRRRAVGLAPGPRRYRILAVDDLAEGRQLLARLLARLGFELREASDGRQAVEAWESWQPDLIWMDMRMPVMDGREATRQIRAREAGTGRHTVIVALTASSFDEERDAILKAGCDEFLRKPYREEELLEVIRSRLGVEFVYEEEPAPSSAERHGDNATRLAALPDEVRMPLEQALRQLDVDAVTSAIEAIRRHDGAAAGMLDELAANFEYERMLAVLSSTTQSDHQRA